MKAITIWQPYAEAIAMGLKNYETRTWKTQYRGKICIHASMRKLSKMHKKLATKYKITELSLGKIVAVADLTDCYPITEALISRQTRTEIELGNWQVGNFAWKLENVIIPKQCFRIKGKQGIWNLGCDAYCNFLYIR